MPLHPLGKVINCGAFKPAYLRRYVGIAITTADCFLNPTVGPPVPRPTWVLGRNHNSPRFFLASALPWNCSGQMDQIACGGIATFLESEPFLRLGAQ